MESITIQQKQEIQELLRLIDCNNIDKCIIDLLKQKCEVENSEVGGAIARAESFSYGGDIRISDRLSVLEESPSFEECKRIVNELNGLLRSIPAKKLT